MRSSASSFLDGGLDGGRHGLGGEGGKEKMRVGQRKVTFHFVGAKRGKKEGKIACELFWGSEKRFMLVDIMISGLENRPRRLLDGRERSVSTSRLRLVQFDVSLLRLVQREVEP